MTLKNGYASGSPLGESVSYKSNYDSSLLHSIDRSAYRASIEGAACVDGIDRWVCYELSWLDSAGKPEVAILTLDIPANSPKIIESKSLKLYLNSFNSTPFSSAHQVASTIAEDLTVRLGVKVDAILSTVGEFSHQSIKPNSRIADTVLVDGLPVVCNAYQRDAQLLQLDDNDVEEQRLVSHLFRSNCPVTNQPDWASLYIDYSGQQINPASLLTYIVSFREHNGFHEQCVEQVYADLFALTGNSTLVVTGRFTRRGGIEINPMRGGAFQPDDVVRINRQ